MLIIQSQFCGNSTIWYILAIGTIFAYCEMEVERFDASANVIFVNIQLFWKKLKICIYLQEPKYVFARIKIILMKAKHCLYVNNSVTVLWEFYNLIYFGDWYHCCLLWNGGGEIWRISKCHFCQHTTFWKKIEILPSASKIQISQKSL